MSYFGSRLFACVLLLGVSLALYGQVTQAPSSSELLTIATRLKKQAESLLMELEILKTSSAKLSATVQTLEADLQKASELSASLERRLTDSLAESEALRMELEQLSARLTSLSVQLAALETDYKTIKLQRDIFGWSALGLGILAIVAFCF